MPDVPGTDPDVLKIQAAARSLHDRGLTDTRILNYVRHELEEPPPILGLQLPANYTATHQTAGLDHFPAIDVFAPPGTLVLAPANCELVWPHFKNWNRGAAIGGWTCYLKANAKLWYFLTHFATVQRRGHYRKGDIIGTVGKVPGSPPWWAPHIHEGRHVGPFDPAQT